jgi:hypothetical protein
MDRKQKILTIVVMIAFCVIIALHYMPLYERSYQHRRYDYQHKQWLPVDPAIDATVPGELRLPPLIQDVQLPLLALAVLYAGCMAVAWRRER